MRSSYKTEDDSIVTIETRDGKAHWTLSGGSIADATDWVWDYNETTNAQAVFDKRGKGTIEGNYVKAIIPNPHLLDVLSIRDCQRLAQILGEAADAIRI